MKKILISVVIPTYNRAIKIERAINSVLNQTYQNFEIIIVDDGSTDYTRQIVEKIKDTRIKYFYKKNWWVSSARNLWIEKSIWEYIAFLDSDDEFEKDKLEIQLNLMSKYNSLFSISNSIEILWENKLKKHKFWWDFKIDKNYFIINKIPISASFFICKRDIFQKILFNNDLPSANDIDFIYMYFINFKNEILFINKPLVKRHKELWWNRISTNFESKIKWLTELLNIYWKNIYQLPKNELDERIYRLTLNLWIYKIILWNYIDWRKDLLNWIRLNKYKIKNIFYFMFYLISFSKLLTKILFKVYKIIWKYL